MAKQKRKLTFEEALSIETQFIENMSDGFTIQDFIQDRNGKLSKMKKNVNELILSKIDEGTDPETDPQIKASFDAIAKVEKLIEFAENKLEAMV